MDPTTENFQYPCLRRVRKVIPRSSFGVDYHDASTENVQTAVQKTLIVNSVKFTEERHLTVKKTVTSSSTIGGRSGVANGVFGKSRVEVDWEVEKHFPSIDHVEDRTKHIKNEEILQWSDVSSLYNDLLQTDQDQRHEKSVLNVRLHSGEQPEGNVRHLTAIKDKQSHEVSSLELSLLDIRALSSDDLSRTDDSDVARLSADDSVSNSGKFENARDSGLYSLEHLRSSDSFGASAESKVSYLDHEDNSFAIDQDKTALKDREKTQIVHQRAGERVPHEASVSIGDSLHDHDLTAGKSEFVASSVSHGQIISSYKDLTVDANNQGLTDDGITSMTTTEGVMSSESEEALEDSRKKKDFQTVLSEEGRDAKISDQFEEDVKALGVGWPVGADTNLSQSPFGTFDEQQDKYRKKSPGFVKGKDPFQHGDQSAFEHEGISVGFDPNVSVSEDQTVTDHSMISGKHIEMAPFFPKGKVPKERGDPKKYEGAFANEDEPEASGIDHSSTGFGSDLKVTGEGKLFGDTRASEGYGPEYEQNREDLALYDVRHKDNTNISADIGKDLMRERQKAADRKDVMQYVEDASLNVGDDDVSLDRGVIPSKAINVPFAEKRQPGLEGNVSSRFKEETSFDFDAKKSGSIPSDQSGLESVFLKSEGQKNSSPASYVSELDKSLSGKSRNRPELGSQGESGDFTEQDSTAHRWDRSEKYASETSVELDNDDLLANQVLFDKTTDRSRQQFVRDDYEQKPNQKSLPESYPEEHLKETPSFKHDAKHDSDIFKETSGDRGHLTVGGGDGLAVKVREGLADEDGQRVAERGDFSTTSVDEVSETLGGQSPLSYGPISSHNVVPFEMSKTPGVTDATLARNQKEADNIGATLDSRSRVNDDFRRGLEHSDISAEITDDPSRVLDSSREVISGKTVNKPKGSEFSAFAGDTSHDAALQRQLDYPDESFDRSVHSEDDQKTADHRVVPTAPINEASAVTDSSISAYHKTLSGKDIEVPSKIQDTSTDFYNKPGKGVTFDEAQDINVYSSSFGAESHVPAKFQENIRGELSMRLASLDHELPAGFAEDFRQSAELESTEEGRQPRSSDLKYTQPEAEKEKHGYIDKEHQSATERGVIPSIAEDSVSIELDYQTPGERGLVSEKLVKGPSSISELHSAPEGGSVPSGFMRGATFGLDSERKGDDHDVSKVGEKEPIGRDVLEDVDGAKQSTSKKRKGKKKGGKNQGNATSLPSTDSKEMLLETQKGDLAFQENQKSSTYEGAGSHLEQGDVFQDPLRDAKPSKTDKVAGTQELQEEKLQEQEENRSRELEEKRRTQELEEQRRIQEFEEQKRLEELAEQKRLEELEEKKRLEKLKEQEHLQNLIVQRQAICQPYLDRLHLHEQKLVSIEKIPSTPENLDEKMTQLEAFQDDLRLLESDLEALEKTKKDEWSEITSGEIESDPLAAAFSNLENLKQLTKKSSDKVQELEEKRRIQKIEEEKKLQELEEKRRAQELEEQRQIQELEEQKRLEELEEQKRLEELEEKKRLEKLKEQERLQDLRVQRQAICQPYLDQLHLCEQKLVSIEKIPSTPEKLDDKKLQLEKFQNDLRLLESDLEALEKTRKDEWSEITSGEIESDPLASALSNLENLKRLAEKSSDAVQELEEKRHIQKIEEEKKLQELEEKRRAQELEEQRQIQELEELKRLEELEEQKRLKELEEKKRLEKLKEQERLQDLRVQRQATCQPYLDQLLLFEQILVNTEKLPSTHEKLDEKKLQLETFSHDLRLLEADLEVLEKTKKDEWSEITSGEIESDPLAVALSNLESLKQLTKKSSDKVQELINDHDQKQDQVSKIEKRIEDVHLWYNCALATTLEPPVRTSSSRFVKEQLMDATNVCKELEIKVQELKDISSQVQSLPTDVSGEHHINEKLSVLNKDISTLKASLEDKIRRLKGDAERNDKKQKEVQALDANLANIQKKTFQILKSSESSPSKEELEAWQNLQKPSRDLQKMLKSHLQEQRELVKNVADQHEILKSPTPTASGKLPRKVLTYMPLPLSTEAGDSENSKILEATIQKKVADLKKYWQDLKKNKAAGLDDYVDGQKEFDAVTSLAFQWLDLIESQAPKMAESQDLQRQMKSFRTIHQELLEQLKDCKEIGRSLKDNLPTSCTEQNILLTESLEDLDRRFLLLEDEVKQREQLAVEKRALRKNLDEQIGSIQRLVLDCQRKYDSLSDGKIPSETRLISCQQLNGACRDGLQKLSELRTDLQLRVVQDPSISVPPDLLLLQHQLRDLDAKIAEKKLDLSRTTDANNQYKNLLEQYAEFLETAPEKDRASKPPVKDLAQLKNQLSSHRDFIRDLLNLQTMVDSAFQKVEPTEKERHNSSHNRLNVATRDVLDKANLEVSQIKQAVDKWSELEPQFSQAIAWLEDMKRRLPRQATDKDSIEMLEKQLLDLKSVQKDLENGYGPVDRVLENGHRLLELVSSPSLQLQLDDVAERRKTLSRELSEDLKSLEALVKQLRQFDSEMNLLEKWKAGSAKKKDTISQLLSSGNLGHDDIAKAETLFRELKDDTDDHENHKATAVALGSRILQQRPSDLHVKNKLTELTGYWSSHEKGISDLEARIQNARKALRPSWQTLDELSQHLDDINRSIGEDKDFSPKNREQVRQLLMKYRSLKSDLADLQLNIDHIDKVKEQSSGTRSLADQTLMAEKLGEVNQRHQALCSDVNSRAVNLELMGDSWKEFDCLAKNLKEWLTAELARVSAEEKNLNGNTIKSTLAACSEFSNKLKEKQGKDFESFTRLGSTLTSSADWPADASSVASIQDDLSKQCHLLKEKINGLKLLAEKMQSCMGDYEHVLTAVNNVIDGTSSSLDQLQHTSGCKPETLKAQISSLRTLQKNFDGSTGLIQQLGTATAALTSTCDPASCLVFQNDKMQAVNRWKVVKNQIAEKLSAVDVLFSKWSKYNERYSDALNWLNTKESEIERLLKDNSQANKVDKLKQKQQELIKFRDRLSELKVLSEEMIPSLDSGQVVHIVSEQAELSELARNLQLSLGRHLENLNLADGDQGKFAEQCGEMEKFLKEVESALSKASASYDASDHNVVDDRLRTVKSLTERFVEASPLFQELNHSGLPLSKAESSRLKDLSSRWHKLKPDSKALERKLQQQSLVLSSFSDKCVEWNKFLAGIENTLSADLLGDYNSIVNQQKLLEKFQEEIPLRQQILNSIVDDGRKILESNEGEAVDFGRKLQLLVEQWQTAVRQAGQRKAIVDDIVALWQTYHKLRNQLLSDVDNVKKFVDGHPVSAGSFISLKNLQDEYEENQCKLESMKPTVEKLRSYVLLLSPNSEPNTVKQIDFEVKSLEEEMKTVSTAVSSGADQLQNVLELWKRVLQKMVDFSASLKESTKYLKPDVPTKYDELVAELKTLEGLKSGKGYCPDELTRDLERLTPLIPPDNSLVLSQRLHLLKERQSQASGQIAVRCETVRDRLNRWEEFDRNVDALMNKYSLIEDKMNKLDVLSIEDSIATIQNDLLPELECLENEKIKLIGTGKELRLNSSGQRYTDVDDKMSRIHERFAQLKEDLNAKLEKLTNTLKTLEQLDNSLRELRRWLLSMEHQLTTPVLYKTSEPSEIENQLKKQELLQKDIDNHEAPVNLVLNHCNIVLSDPVACPTGRESQAFQLARDKLEFRWKNINDISVQRKHLIEETGQLWNKFSVSHQLFNSWLLSKEQQVASPKTQNMTFDAMRGLLGEIRKLRTSFQTEPSELRSLNLLYCRLAREGRTDSEKTLKKKIDQSNQRWDRLLAKTDIAADHVSHIISVKDDFDKNHRALMGQLSSCNNVLIGLEQQTGPPSAKIINYIKKELDSYSDRINYIDRAGGYLKTKCEPSDAVKIQKNIDDLHRLHSEILRRLKLLGDRQPSDAEDKLSSEKMQQLESDLAKYDKLDASELETALGHLDKGDEDLYSTPLGGPLDDFEETSADLQEVKKSTPERGDRTTPGERRSYLGLLKRACRTAIPVQMMLLVLVGLASLVPMCENECLLNSLNPILKFADGPPPL